MDGFFGMEKFTAEELYEWADEIEARLGSSDNEDDPKWLQRQIDKLRVLARQKENSIEHKRNQS